MSQANNAMTMRWMGKRTAATRMSSRLENGAGSWPEKIASGLAIFRSEEHTSELQSRFDLVCRLLLEKKNANAMRSLVKPAAADGRSQQAVEPRKLDNSS